jgi:hypothetical protein
MSTPQEQPAAADTLRRRSVFRLPWLTRQGKSATTSKSPTTAKWHWLAWIAGLRQRLHLRLGQLLHVPFWLVIGILALLGGAQQAYFYLHHNPATSSEPLDIVPRRLVLPFLLVYLATILRILRTQTATALQALRPVVKIEDAVYQGFVQDMLRAPRRDIFVIVMLNAATTLILYVILGIPLPMAMYQTVPSNVAAALFVLTVLILLGCLIYLLVYRCVRYSIGLNRLSKFPLVINVLDPYALLPFGRLALQYSLSLVSLLMVVILPLGMPEKFDEYLLVVLASLGGLWALIGPLWGIHKRIEAEKQLVLQKIHEQFREVQETLLDGTRFEKEELDDLSARAEKLIKLRSLIWDSPNWPFRTSAGYVRAVLAALFPLLLVVLQEIAKTYTNYVIGGPPPP